MTDRTTLGIRQNGALTRPLYNKPNNIPTVVVPSNDRGPQHLGWAKSWSARRQPHGDRLDGRCGALESRRVPLRKILRL